jgi:hypothetical protein
MKLRSSWTRVVLASVTVGGVLAAIACGTSAPPGFDYNLDDGSTSSGGSSGSGGSGSSGGGTDGGSGGGMDATLVTYDGPPPNVDGGLLGCSTPNGLPVKFNPVYSGYDGVHTYQVPVFVVGANPASVTWGSSDPTMVSFQPYVRGIMITTKKAGTVQIIATVTSGGKTICGTTPLTITPYTTAEWQLGHDRYNNMQPLTTTSLLTMFDASIPDGGLDGNFAGYDAGADAGNCQSLPAGFSNPFDNPPAACTNCHGPVGNGQIFGRTLFSDVSHTPEQTGGYSESELTGVYMTGTVPAGGYFDNSIICYANWHAFHQWYDINTTEGQKGMNAFLRSLTPMQQLGCFDIYATCDGG